ncbi:MAG: MBL fold metallo-hydrolase [Bacteroidales bacterium]|nr:MBL fold metallo-hydrolase [Bacteroidales bacterium]
MANKVIFLGTGTSSGIPMLGCSCPVCTSADARDKRLRCSVYVEYEGLRLLVDAGPDFRTQLLRENITHVDAVLLTHHHKDHTGGLDDVRSFNYFEQRPFPVYCEEYVQESLRREYCYAFDEHPYPGAPQFELHTITDKPFTIGSVEIVPVRAMHYKLPILGFRFGKFGYLTDASAITDADIEKFRGVEFFVINAIRYTSHISHFSVPEALQVIDKVGARRSFFTHLSHQLPAHEPFAAALPAGVEPAYDGLRLDF